MKRFRHLGFQYIVGHRRGSRILSVERVPNLMPLEGIHHMFNTEFRGGAQVATWYGGLFEGNYVPVSTDVMATFPTLATECVAYTQATRVEWVEGAPSGGIITSAEMTFTLSLAKTVYGAFLSSSSVKGGVSGTLGSATRFSAPKVGAAGDDIFVIIPFELVSTV